MRPASLDSARLWVLLAPLLGSDSGTRIPSPASPVETLCARRAIRSPGISEACRATRAAVEVHAWRCA